MMIIVSLKKCVAGTDLSNQNEKECKMERFSDTDDIYNGDWSQNDKWNPRPFPDSYLSSVMSVDFKWWWRWSVMWIGSDRLFHKRPLWNDGDVDVKTNSCSRTMIFLDFLVKFLGFLGELFWISWWIFWQTCVAENSADDHHNEGCQDQNEVGAKHAFALLATVNNEWQNIWEYLGIFGNIWKYLGLFGNIWEYLGIFGNIWEYMGIYGQFVLKPSQRRSSQKRQWWRRWRQQRWWYRRRMCRGLCRTCLQGWAPLIPPGQNLMKALCDKNVWTGDIVIGPYSFCPQQFQQFYLDVHIND